MKKSLQITLAAGGAGSLVLYLALVHMGPSREVEIESKNGQQEQAFKAWINGDAVRAKRRDPELRMPTGAGLNYAELRSRMLRSGYRAAEIARTPDDATCAEQEICNSYEEVLDCAGHSHRRLCRFVYTRAADLVIVTTSGVAAGNPASLRVIGVRHASQPEAASIRHRLV